MNSLNYAQKAAVGQRVKRELCARSPACRSYLRGLALPSKAESESKSNPEPKLKFSGHLAVLNMHHIIYLLPSFPNPERNNSRR